MANIPVSSAINTLLISTNLNASTTALGALGAPVTGASIATKLETEILNVNGWILVNSSAVALANGVIGFNNTLNTLVKHNGSTVGGVPILVSNPSHKKGTVSASNYTAAKETEIASFPLTATQAIVGKRFRFSYKIEIIMNGTGKPPNFYFGITTRSNITNDLGGLGAFPARLGYLEGFSYPTTSADTWLFTGIIEHGLSADVTNFALSPYSVNHKGIIFNGAAISGSTKALADTVAIGTDVGLIGTNNEELVFVFQGEASGSSGCICNISYDIKFEQTV